LHQEIDKILNCNTYFSRPYTPQDKGTIENRNGVIRLFFPKKTNFNHIHQSTKKSVETKINNRPLRKFKYLTSNQIALQLKI
jgi:IS30 family transposase